MSDRLRIGGQIQIDAKDPDDRYGNAPQSHLWQAHVHEEEGEKHPAASNIHHFAEEYASCAMQGVDATSNEFQLAEEQGERHGIGEVPEEIASAGDIVGG